MNRQELNQALRRAMRKYVQRPDSIKDTRKLAYLFASHYRTPYQRIFGNIRALCHDYHSVFLTTVTPGVCTLMSKRV